MLRKPCSNSMLSSNVDASCERVAHNKSAQRRRKHGERLDTTHTTRTSLSPLRMLCITLENSTVSSSLAASSNLEMLSVSALIFSISALACAREGASDSSHATSLERTASPSTNRRSPNRPLKHHSARLMTRRRPNLGTPSVRINNAKQKKSIKNQ